MLRTGSEVSGSACTTLIDAFTHICGAGEEHSLRVGQRMPVQESRRSNRVGGGGGGGGGEAFYRCVKRDPEGRK